MASSPRDRELNGPEPSLGDLGPERRALLDAAGDLASTPGSRPLLEVLLDHLERLVPR